MKQNEVKPYTHKVQYYETDKMQVTHHSNYLRFLEEARIDFLDQIGWGYAKMEEEGIISPVLSLTCDYKHATTFPDVLTIQVTIAQISAVRLTLAYKVTCGDKIACTATTTHCFIKNNSPMVLKKEYPDFYNTLLELTEN
jgi:acyl-CoA thioester hydrolase